MQLSDNQTNNNNNNNSILYLSQQEIKAVVRSHNEEHLSIILSHKTHAHTHSYYKQYTVTLCLVCRSGVQAGHQPRRTESGAVCSLCSVSQRCAQAGPAEQAIGCMKDFNTLMYRVAQDHRFLEEALRRYVCCNCY